MSHQEDENGGKNMGKASLRVANYCNKNSPVGDESNPHKMKVLLHRLGKKRRMPGFSGLDGDGDDDEGTTDAEVIASKKTRIIADASSIESPPKSSSEPKSPVPANKPKDSVSLAPASSNNEDKADPSTSVSLRSASPPQQRGDDHETTITRVYIDCATLPDPPRLELTESFVEKVYNMLEQIEFNAQSHVVSFLHHGRAFAIHHDKMFVENLPKFGLPQTSVEDFELALMDHGFRQIESECDKGAFYHELFLRSRPGLCVNLRSNATSAQNAKRQHPPEPNFAEYPPVPPMPFRGTEIHVMPRGRNPMAHVMTPHLPMPTVFPVRHAATLYCDWAAWPDPPLPMNPRGLEGHLSLQLHGVLQQMHLEGNSHIASFLHHGRAFAIYDQVGFQQAVMPRFFPSLTFQEFLRNVVDFGFAQLRDGPDAGAFYHELFLRGRPGLCVNMQRRAFPQPFDKQHQLNFQDYPPMPVYGGYPPFPNMQPPNDLVVAPSVSTPKNTTAAQPIADPKQTAPHSEMTTAGKNAKRKDTPTMSQEEIGSPQGKVTEKSHAMEKEASLVLSA
ncbi:unnamed protein product [Cylindrotheca closterium]|uniref:HSF-type DNA-binding domain-containing protein n=1 Tax=Cylindrotheca closterium TaxID=2856 RepID=A0AAD2FGV8_9STRA|nr:unnamed protein product [Cylindrotheca closterium]